MSRRRKIIWLCSVLLVLAGGIGGFWWYWQATALDRKVRHLVYEAADYPDTRTEKILKKWKLNFLLHEKPKARDCDEVEKDIAVLGSEATPELVSLLSDENDMVRLKATQFILAVGDKRSVEPLILALQNDTFDWVRNYAIDALGKLGDIRATDSLIRALQEEDNWYGKSHAAHALGKLNDKKAVEPLILALRKDNDAWVRYYAAQSLGNLGDARAIKPLESARQNGLISADEFNQAMERFKSAATRPAE